MLTRFDAYRPYALLLTVPVTLLWTPALGAFLGAIVVTTHALAVLFLAAWWTRRDLERGLNPRLGLISDRFSVDREALDLAAPMLGLFALILTLVLIFTAPAAGFYAAFIILAGVWHAALAPPRRFSMIELIAPAALIIGPAMLLRAPAWRGDAINAISPAAHAAAWLIGALMLAQLLITMLRDRNADRAANITTSLTSISRSSSIAIIALTFTAITLLAALGAGAHWWGIAPVLFTGWTSTATIALLCIRWDSWAVGTATIGGALTAITTALSAI